MSYPFHEVESRWQRFWRENATFAVDTSQTDQPRFYVLGMFPYPSGEGLHIGHPESYTATDILGRYYRHRGRTVLNPMGWDAFGLPAEQYAMKTNVHPRLTTQRNTETFRRQLEALGIAYDWSREINTTDPAYYRWTQWIFLKLYNCWFDRRIEKGRSIETLIAELDRSGTAEIILPRSPGREPRALRADEWGAMNALERQDYLTHFRLVYEAEFPVNWCEGLGSVLADEEVDEWTEKGFTVERRPMRQWMMRITDYADRLLAGHDHINWPTSTITMQKEWIGRSTGAELVFDTDAGASIRVFTTRPDTLYGVTFVMLAPEHPLVDALTTPEQRHDVDRYRRETATKSDLDRQMGTEKTGVFTGGYAHHPATGEKIPVWIGDYVLATYGTGAVMGVPAHDERDFEFAGSFHLPIVPVIEPDAADASRDAVMAGEACYTGVGTMRNSGPCNGIDSEQGKQRIVELLGDHARTTVQYRLRDWLFSRQRYWGEPIPIVRYDNGIVEPLDESELPLTLPDLAEFKPSGSTESPLALATDWLEVLHPVHGRGRRETNTMPQWAGSSWYYIRYLDPHNEHALVDHDIARHWLPVDVYIGGAEHAVTHLLYSRFWHKVLHDLGYLPCEEPFQRMIHQGLILGENGLKISKSRGNAINPDDVIAEYGADALRLFEMFMGPLELAKPWSSKGIEGLRRFLNRAWRMMFGDEDAGVVSTLTDRPLNDEEASIVHRTIKKVTDDVEALRFNTAIAELMMFVNEFTKASEKPRDAMEAFVRLLSPFAPHIAEEMWMRLGHQQTIANEPWPEFDPTKTRQASQEIVLQVNSRIKARISVAPGTDTAELERLARDHDGVKAAIAGKQVQKVIAVADRLVNLIVA